MLSVTARLFIDVNLVALAISVLWYWVPLIAVFVSRPRIKTSLPSSATSAPRLLILAPCFNAEGCLGTFMKCMLSQDYPRDRYRIVIIADNCTDDSARRASELGADEVYDRKNPQRRGKGYALQEYLQQSLQYEPFDRLLLFDIDAQVEAGYLRAAASYNLPHPAILQGSTVSKNPDDSLFTRIGDLIQLVLRLHQAGRAVLNLPPILIGSHGICVNREALERLDWRIAPKGFVGDDLELGLRGILNGISIIYAPELRVVNDLPIQGNAIRRQRRRWTRSVLRLAPLYAPSLLRRGLSDWRALESMIGVLLLPSFSNLFLLLTATSLTAWAVSTLLPALRPEAFAAVALWVCDVFYLGLALWRAGARARWTDVVGIPCYLAVRAIALVESVVFICSKEWWPTAHPGDKAQCQLAGSIEGGAHD